MKKFIVIFSFFVPFCAFSQFSDNFSDGKFTGIPPQIREPEWSGDVQKFAVNDTRQLQLNAPKDGSPAQLRTASESNTNSLWECEIKMNFNPTSSNYAKVYLCSDQEDLTGELNGLFVRTGYTNKNVCLVSQKGKTNKMLIEGESKRLDIPSPALRIRVTINKKGICCLYSRLEGESEYILEGSCFITDTPVSNWFGLVCQYTSTRNSHFYFDDFVVRELSEDEQGDIDTEPGIEADSLDVVINELLFNPPAGGNEYIEIYNRSDKTIDLRYLSIATRKTSDGSLNKAYPLAADPFLLHPGEYVVATEGADLICAFFACRSSSFFTELGVMPTLTNTSGCVVLLNNQTDQLIDELYYSENMHAEGMSNRKGVALERLNAAASSENPENWHSASAEAGYGTPGYENSQHALPAGTSDEIHIVYPDIIIDSYQIKYRFASPGYRCHTWVFDSMGRIVNTVANNELLGTEGTLLWNGQGSHGQKLTSGIYIIYMEVFDMKGNVIKFKRPAVVK